MAPLIIYTHATFAFLKIKRKRKEQRATRFRMNAYLDIEAKRRRFAWLIHNGKIFRREVRGASYICVRRALDTLASCFYLILLLVLRLLFYDGFWLRRDVPVKVCRSTLIYIYCFVNLGPFWGVYCSVRMLSTSAHETQTARPDTTPHPLWKLSTVLHPP